MCSRFGFQWNLEGFGLKSKNKYLHARIAQQTINVQVGQWVCHRDVQVWKHLKGGAGDENKHLRA